MKMQENTFGIMFENNFKWAFACIIYKQKIINSLLKAQNVIIKLWNFDFMKT